MGLTMSQRKAVTRATARRYQSGSRAGKAKVLDELCELTRWHRDHARRALREALGPQRVPAPRKARAPVYGEDVMVALAKVWAVMDAPAGKRMAPFLPEIVGRLRAFGELDLDDAQAAMLCAMSAATIDRRMAGRRKQLALKGRSGTKPGSLLKSQIPIRTWAQWDEKAPGFVEIDLVGHEGGDAHGEYAQTLTVTDVFTGWTETKAVRNKAQKWVFAALVDLRGGFPFPIRGIDSDNGSEFINSHLLRYCQEEEITFTRSRSGNKNDGAFVEQKNWSVVRRAVGYHRYDTGAELELLNAIYALLRLQTNFFTPQQKLLEKHRHGAKVTKRYDTAKTPYQRVLADTRVSQEIKDSLGRRYEQLNPAQIRREITALQDQLLTLVRAKHPPTRLPVKAPPARRASTGEATKTRRRAS